MSQGVDGIRPLSCNIKPAVYLHIRDAKADPAQSGVCVVDVSLPFGKQVSVSCSAVGYYDNHHAIRTTTKNSSCFIVLLMMKLVSG